MMRCFHTAIQCSFHHLYHLQCWLFSSPRRHPIRQREKDTQRERERKSERQRERVRENNGLAGNRKRDKSCSNWSGSGLLGCASSSLVCPPSPSSGQSVQLRLASISPPHPPFLSASVFLPDLRGRPQRAGRLNVSTSLIYFPEVSLFVSLEIVERCGHGSNLPRDTGIPAEEETAGKVSDRLALLEL